MTKNQQKSHRNNHHTHMELFNKPTGFARGCTTNTGVINWFYHTYIPNLSNYTLYLFWWNKIEKIQQKKIITFIFILLKMKRKLRRNVNLYLYIIIFTLPKVIVVITLHQIQPHFIYSTFKVDSINHTLSSSEEPISLSKPTSSWW